MYFLNVLLKYTSSLFADFAFCLLTNSPTRLQIIQVFIFVLRFCHCCRFSETLRSDDYLSA